MRIIRAAMIALVHAGVLLSGAPQAVSAADGIRGANRKIREQGDIKEIGLGSAPISSLAPRPKDLKITSRYCQAALVLDNGEKDTLYWRIDVIVQGADRSTNYDHCSTRHDTFQDQCISYRERN